MRSSIRGFDSHFTALTNQIFPHESWRSFFGMVTVLGDPITIIVITIGIIVAGVYSGSTKLIISGVAIPITVGIGALLKLLVERARPISEYSAHLGTFSFPSGHSTGSVVAYGLLAYFAYVKLPGPWGVIAAFFLLTVPIAVGISRIHLGAHYPSDVLAGWLLGLLGLLIIIIGIRPI